MAGWRFIGDARTNRKTAFQAVQQYIPLQEESGYIARPCGLSHCGKWLVRNCRSRWTVWNTESGEASRGEKASPALVSHQTCLIWLPWPPLSCCQVCKGAGSSWLGVSGRPVAAKLFIGQQQWQRSSAQLMCCLSWVGSTLALVYLGMCSGLGTRHC